MAANNGIRTIFLLLLFSRFALSGHFQSFLLCKGQPFGTSRFLNYMEIFLECLPLHKTKMLMASLSQIKF